MNDSGKMPTDYAKTAVEIWLSQDGPSQAWLIDEAEALIDAGGDDASVRARLKEKGAQGDDGADHLIFRARARRTFAAASTEFAEGKADTAAIAEVRREAEEYAARTGAESLWNGNAVARLVHFGASDELARHVCETSKVGEAAVADSGLSIGLGIAMIVVALIYGLAFDGHMGLVAAMIVAGLGALGTGFNRRKRKKPA